MWFVLRNQARNPTTLIAEIIAWDPEASQPVKNASASRVDFPRFFEIRSLSGHHHKVTMRRIVRDLMVPDVIVAKPGDILEDVRELMHAHGIHSLPVADAQGKLVGIVTSSDLMPGFSGKIPVSRIMSTEIYTVTPDTTVSTAAEMMRNYRVHHMVVIDGEKVVGILSSFDLLRLIEEL